VEEIVIQLVVVCPLMVCVKDVMRTEVTTNKTKPMVRDFKFFETGSNVIPQPRLPRTPIAHIRVPPFTHSEYEYRRAFINGWRAYEFGREMQTWVELRGTGDLDQAIDEYSEEMGVEQPYDASNECVKRGFDDANSDIESPYNKEGKSWSTF
jgi:hypothetical protein